MRLKLLVLLLLISNAIYANDLNIIKTEQSTISYEEYQAIKHVGTKSAMCTATANPASGFAGQNVTASGHVSYTITNNSSSTQNYWADEYMCINGASCTHIRNTVTLAAHLTGTGGGTLYTSAVLGKGTYVDQASIQVTGESTCFVQGNNSVWIN
jgi:hypothetical protein